MKKLKIIFYFLFDHFFQLYLLSNAFKSNKITKSIQLNITAIERILYWLPAFPSVHQHVHPASRSCIRTQPVQSGPDTARPRPRLAALLFVHEKPTAFGSILRRRFFLQKSSFSAASLPYQCPTNHRSQMLHRWSVGQNILARRGGDKKYTPWLTRFLRTIETHVSQP